MVELQGGSITIDGINIRDLRLESLRGRLALVPQDSTLFLGTLRDNLYVLIFLTARQKLIYLWGVSSDPQNLRTDAEMITVLQRAWLLPRDGKPDPVAEAKFSLQSNVGDEGA